MPKTREKGNSMTLGTAFEEWAFTQALAEVRRLHPDPWRVDDRGHNEGGVLVHYISVVETSGNALSLGLAPGEESRRIATEIVERAASGGAEGVSKEAVNCLLLAVMHGEYLKALELRDHPERTLLNLANGGSWSVDSDGLYSLFDLGRRIIEFGPRVGDQMAIDALRQRMRAVWEAHPFVQMGT
jgi:hypothetical protein